MFFIGSSCFTCCVFQLQSFCCCCCCCKLQKQQQQQQQTARKNTMYVLVELINTSFLGWVHWVRRRPNTHVWVHTFSKIHPLIWDDAFLWGRHPQRDTNRHNWVPRHPGVVPNNTVVHLHYSSRERERYSSSSSSRKRITIIIMISDDAFKI